jgi:GTP-binding protein
VGDHASRGSGLIRDAAAPGDVFPARDFDPTEVEAGRLLFARDCRFVAAASGSGPLPPERLPEVAFIGRSNVGKSSLINALVGRRGLARTSNTPGRTQQINFFDLGGRLMLVDLPGYGYAAAPRKAIQAWIALMRRYLRGRGTLRRACLLIDARHGIKPADQPLLQLCDEAGLSCQAIFTKTDKARPGALHDTLAMVAAELSRHTAAHPEIHLTSAFRGAGLPALRATLAGLADMALSPEPR